MQEVETEQFRLLFQPELKALGYTGIFSPKSRAKTMNEEDRKYVDGCAIFWKSEKLVHKILVNMFFTSSTFVININKKCPSGVFINVTFL